MKRFHNYGIRLGWKEEWVLCKIYMCGVARAGSIYGFDGRNRRNLVNKGLVSLTKDDYPGAICRLTRKGRSIVRGNDGWNWIDLSSLPIPQAREQDL